MRVFDPPNQVWDVANGSIKKVAECDIKSITSDVKMIEFFKPHDNGSPLVIIKGYGFDAWFLTEVFPRARVIPLCNPPSAAVNLPTIEERILYSVNKK